MSAGATAPIRVLVAEDSALFVDVVVDILESDPAIRVVGVASNGERAVQMTEALRPDVVLMDVRMPVLDGLAAIEAIMASVPTPILVMTADPNGPTGPIAFDALARGALDLVPKPTTWSGTEEERNDLRTRVKMIAAVRVVRVRKAVAPAPLPPVRRPERDPGPHERVVGIGASTGGPPALARLLSTLPGDYPHPVLIVQHLSTGFDRQLVSWLRDVCSLPVDVATHGRRLAPGVLVAPCDVHLRVESTGVLTLSSQPPEGGHRPSVDVLFSSLATAFGARAVGVLLTGMGMDGARGLLEIRDRGGLTIAQDEASSAVFGMPRAAIELGAAKDVAALDEIGPLLKARTGARAGRGERRS